MALMEDAATVLELFIHDVANLPAEVAHLYEEASAKQDLINEYNQSIANKDGTLQKWIKASGSLSPHPKEDALNKEIMEAYDKVRSLQDERIALVQKACSLLDRYVKRLDIKIRDLQNEGSMPLDPQMPTLLRQSPGNLVPADSNANTGTNTPLQPLSVNANSSTMNLGHAAINRIANAALIGRAASMGAQSRPMPSSQSTSAPTATSGTTAAVAAAAAAGPNGRHRESSVGHDPKRRRLIGPLGTLPPPSVNPVRHSSLGPGTPKATTPGVHRAGSVGPRPVKKPTTLKKPLVQQLSRKKLPKGAIPKQSARRLFGGSRASPSTTTGDDSGDEEGSDDGEFETEHVMGQPENDETSDDTKYCYCRDVSHGDMIACDNADCGIQWFHWSCAGITAEPTGEWLCKECRRLPRDKIKKA